MNMDGSWQAWFATRPLLAAVASRILRRQIGHWPRRIVCWNVRRGLCYGTASVGVVFSSHFIEHLYRDDAVAFLREAWRVLMPRGICRIVVPDVRAIVQWYLDCLSESPDRRPASSDLLMDMLSLRQRSSRASGPLGWYRRWSDFDSHKWMYDVEGLLSVFREAGFADPHACGHLESDIPRELLMRVEQVDRVANGAGICVEARR